MFHLENEKCFGTAFFHETSLHGWKYVQTSSAYARYAWLALLILAMTTASIFVFKAIEDFLSHTVSTNMDSLSTSYDNLYFPAITVCNMNFMQRYVNNLIQVLFFHFSKGFQGKLQMQIISVLLEGKSVIYLVYKMH